MQNVKEDRNKYIGGSDIPIIMGLSPFKKRFDLLLEKAGLKEDAFEGNEYTEYGNIMEEKIRNFLSELMGREYKEGKHIIEIPSVDGIDIRCHTDGETENEVLEIKTTSNVVITGSIFDNYKLYIVQLLFYMQNTGKDNGALVIYDRPNDMSTEFNEKRLVIYPIDIKEDRCQKLLEEINKAVTRFLVDLDKVKANPFITEEELIPQDIVRTTDAMLILEEKLKEYKKIQEEYDEQKKKLLVAMKEAGVPTWKTVNGITITVVEGTEAKEVEKIVFNEDKFKEEHERMYKKYLENKTTVQKGRSSYLRITHPK